MSDIAQDHLIDLMERLGRKPIVVASHPRSGTHLMIDCLRLNFSACRSWKLWGEKSDALYLDMDRIVSHERRLTIHEVERAIRRTSRPIIKTHALADFSHVYVGQHDPFSPNLVAWLKQNASFIYMHRDGRDSLSSGFIHWGARNACSTLGEYIRLPDENQPSRAAAWAHHVRTWLAEPGVCHVSMEELLSHPQKILGDLASRFGLVAPRGKLRLPRIRRKWPMGRLWRALSLGAESTAVLLTDHHHDWRQSLTGDDHDAFEHDAGDVLAKLGYQKSDSRVIPINSHLARSA